MGFIEGQTFDNQPLNGCDFVISRDIVINCALAMGLIKPPDGYLEHVAGWLGVARCFFQTSDGTLEAALVGVQVFSWPHLCVMEVVKLEADGFARCLGKANLQCPQHFDSTGAPKITVS